MTTLCAEHQISRKTFYAIRARTRTDGAAAALEPRSRRPKSSPTRLTDDVKDQALSVRAALESSGLDHGPTSVHDKMHTLGLYPVPSIASLDRIFRQAGVARLEPKKRPLVMAPVRVPGTERVLAAGRDRVRADRWTQVCDLPAHR